MSSFRCLVGGGGYLRRSLKPCWGVMDLIYFLFCSILLVCSFGSNKFTTPTTSSVHFPSLLTVTAAAPPPPATPSDASSTTYSSGGETVSAAATVGRTVSKEEENVFLAEFREYDLNSDDLLDAHELRAMHSDVEPAEIIQFFNNVDVDDTGTITFSEYLDYITTLS
eukprot:GHVS01041085.1.p1 GENE.GHVS01041085.1~~GHVS01041085.1.p1  ORF type:complete len:167 (-),score=41.75 GHVS01041085.1:157-657(-)